MLHKINIFLKQNCVLQTVDDLFIRVEIVQKFNASKNLRVDKFYMYNVDKHFIHELAIEYKSNKVQKYNFTSKTIMRFSTLKKNQFIVFHIFRINVDFNNIYIHVYFNNFCINVNFENQFIV